VVHVLIGAHVDWGDATLAKVTGPWPYWAQLLGSALIVALSYAAASLSWKYYENPLLRLKRHFGGQRAPIVSSRSALLDTDTA
jgi:peptidoglycan/LPS O-acetylase OafA/YrhL